MGTAREKGWLARAAEPGRVAAATGSRLYLLARRERGGVEVTGTYVYGFDVTGQVTCTMVGARADIFHQPGVIVRGDV